MRRSLAAFLGLAPSWCPTCWWRWDPTGAASTPPGKWRSTPALHRLPSAAEKPSGCIVALPAPSLSNKASMSLPDNRSRTATGLVPIMTTRKRKVRGITWQSAPLPIGGSESSIVVGKILFPTTSKRTWNRSCGSGQTGWRPSPTANSKRATSPSFKEPRLLVTSSLAAAKKM